MSSMRQLKKCTFFEDCDNHFNTYEDVGYWVLGPILYYFACWIDKSAKELNVDKLCFLTREGTLLRKAYITAVKDPTNNMLLEVSRKAVLYPQLLNSNCLEDVFSLMHLSWQRFTVGQLLEYLGVDWKTKECEIYRIRLDKLSNQQKDELYAGIKNELINNASEQMHNAVGYLKQMLNGYNNALVDVGWHGTIQKGIESIVPNKKIEGLYLGDLSILPNTKSCFFDKKRKSWIRNEIMYTAGLFELLFLSTEGTVLSYSYDGKKYSANRDVPEYTNEEKKSIEMMQCAALRFVKEYTQFNKRTGNLFDEKEAIRNYITFIRSNECTTLFDNFGFKNATVNKLFPPNGIKYYIVHPKEFIIDFGRSSCKSIFLKKIFKAPLPYSQLISIINKGF